MWKREAFVDHEAVGTLELITFSGNVTLDAQGQLHLHSHAIFTYLGEGEDGEQVTMLIGHLKKSGGDYDRRTHSDCSGESN